MAIIAPCITVETVDEFTRLSQSYTQFARRIHVDISDGEFAPTFLLSADQMRFPSEIEVDIHAMVARPSEYVDQLIALRPHTIIFHVEVTEDLVPTIQKIKQAGIRAGVALLKRTVPKTRAEAIELAEHALVFSGELGKYGGVADMMQLEKVRLIRMIHPTIEVGWDGGASPENAFSLNQGGVDVINVGGALSKAADPKSVYDQMMSEINKHGVI
jgi:ribulose-phosphate 3-epimerase